MSIKSDLLILGKQYQLFFHSIHRIMGDRLDDEPNIPLPRNKLSTQKVAGETEPEKSHHSASNIPWIRTGSKSVHIYPSQAQNDRSIPDKRSVSLQQPVKAEPEKVLTNITSSNINTDLEPSLTVNNLPFHNQFTSKRQRGDSNEPTDHTVPTSQAHTIEHDARPKEDITRVLGSNDVAVEPSSVDNHEHAKPTQDVSDYDVTVDDQSTSLIMSKAGLQTLLEKFQDFLQQANDLQRRNETFLHSIRHDDRTSRDDLQRRLTETKDNLTHLKDRIQDGDKELRSLEETVGQVVRRVDGLCEAFERKSTAQSAIVFHGDGDKHSHGHRDKHSRHRQDKTTDRRDRKQLTNQKDQHETTHREEDNNKLDTDDGQPRDEQLGRGDDNSHHKYDTGSRRQTESKPNDGDSPSNVHISTDISGLHVESNSPHRSVHVADEGETRRQSASSSSETSKDIRKPKKGDVNSAISTDVHERNRINSNVPEMNEPHVDDVKRNSRAKSKSKSGDRRRSKSMLKKESSVSREQKVTQLRSKPGQLKCSELGFKYRKTKVRGDNRVKVIRHEVVLRGGATCDLVDSNIKFRNPRKETSTNSEGAKYASHNPFFDVQGDFDAFDLHSDVSALGLDAMSMTEADITASNNWVSKANEERRRGTFLAPYRGKGPDTVLLLDTSESMRGQPFNDMIQTAKQIIDGIQNISMTIGVEENIGIAVFGQETTVLRHLTMDYVDLKSSLDTLKAAGPSPLSAGFVMGLAALLGNASGITSVKNVPLSPRVILISDGHATLDRSTTEEKSENALMTSHIRLLLLPVLNDHAHRGNRVFCVPVGDAKMVYFEDICKQTKGRIYLTSDVHRLVKMTQAEVSAIEMFEGLKGNNREQMLEILTAGSMYGSSVQQDAEDIVDYIEYLRKRDTSTMGLEQPMHKEHDPNMPPIGTRMRRGSAWKWANQDTEGPGTVIGHQKNGMIWVEWDNGFKNRYHYQPGSYDVKEVDEPRQILGDHLIAVGYQVKRGIDWTNGDQDGGQGSIGTVFLVKENGNVGVRWQNGRMDIYKFGAEGRFDLEICDPNTTPRPRVKTGREGSPNVQTGGNDSLPRITPRNDPSLTMVQPDSNSSRHIESYLPSVEEMNRKNTSSTSSASKPQPSSTHSKEKVVSCQDLGSGDVESSVKPDPSGTDYRVKWQYANSEGQFKDYPGNVNGKMEATYIKRPSGTVIINMDGVG
ncbi:E3 ubiquitin-protein ligase HERC2 [Mizuhopecten yessoensis]|uniref:E3 ubiquitin-protein ligase HERC2 n=1 Tax=Mizuhopecten yessoensis TaxID=6573 RepID=A0A210Q1K3_MIZYE|nr:E3 ubiquitin-protein ligase HERC2 [Mizuhopecten yessoensis]